MLYFKYRQTYLNTSASNRFHKKTMKKRKKIERNDTHATKWNKWWRANSNMCHETAPLIVFIRNKKRVHEIFLKSKLQIMQLKISTSILGFKNYFFTYSALQTLVPRNLCLLLRLSQILNIFNIFFSSSLNRLNTLRPYQKFVEIGNVQNLGSGLYLAKLCSRDKHCTHNNW